MRYLTNVFRNVMQSREPNSCMFCSRKHESEKCPILWKSDISLRWKIADNNLYLFCFRRDDYYWLLLLMNLSLEIQKCLLELIEVNYFMIVVFTMTDRRNGLAQTRSRNYVLQKKWSEKIANTPSNNVLLRICPVTLYGSEGQIDTFTCLNDGSTDRFFCSLLVWT